ncbi:MAG: hypothetical protein K9H49_05055 [Bacteroidales bacterium]|nr:hypothetical protein [Bacteroidales bacterium]MCF8392015.1 hypothetical protein [Bacteroidales bacterium]
MISWRKNIVLVLLLLLVFYNCRAQNGTRSDEVFHQRSFSGELKLKTLYRNQESLFNEVPNEQQSFYYIGGLRLHSSSYLWDPDILLLDVEGELNPESRDETYLTIPDRSEVRTLNKLGIKATAFNNKPLTLNTYLNFNQSYFNRELLTDVKSDNRLLGGILTSNNKYLPLSLSFRKTKWDQTELQSGRNFSMDQSNIEGRIYKTFGQNDKNELVYSHDEYNYRYSDLDDVINKTDRMRLSNNFYFDEKKNYSYNSLISYINQKGNHEYNRIESIQRILFNLPNNFRFTGNYDYYNRDELFQTTAQNRVRGELHHKLFLSLKSNLFIDYSNLNRKSTFESQESTTKSGIDFKYTKKIPLGQLNLAYSYFRQHQSAVSESPLIQIRSEEHKLSDDEIVLLDKAFIDPASIEVKDETGTIQYRQDLDYILVERNNFIEIQRVLGGLIVDNQIIYVDYIATPPGTYDYNAHNNSFSASLLLFKHIIELYYRRSAQDYSNISQNDLLTLNYYTQNMVGGRVDIGFVRFGIELDDYESSIIPYQMMRYYMNLNAKIGKKFLLSLNGNIRDYIIIDNETDRLYANLSGRLAYNINRKMKVNLDVGYLNQSGRNIDLEALTGRLEFISNFRQLSMKAGLEVYNRMYVNSSHRLNGGYIQIARKF